MDYYSNIPYFIGNLILFGVIPVLNWFFVWRLFNKDWQKIVYGFGLGLATPLLNFMIYYVLYFALYPIIMRDEPLGGETPLFKVIHSVVTIVVCGGFTYWLYRFGMRTRYKSKNPVNPVNPVKK
jgi:hypothetical protein